MSIFYIQYECIPSPESEDYAEYGGAFISCWLKTNSIENAKLLAEKSIKENHWVVKKLEESYPVQSKDYDENEENLEYYQQAEIDGEVYVYDAWPNEPQEEEQVH